MYKILYKFWQWVKHARLMRVASSVSALDTGTMRANFGRTENDSLNSSERVPWTPET
jgi:hypothetical protein